ncbi:MAG: pssA [Burkholderiales bacterium]|jgi:CDP-diacylglycerol--serine O-phosphatidyltransferase|nr:pssA [Burkholderiales bacterium]
MIRSTNTNRVSPIYLLPNLLTLGAMFSGFFAIVQSIYGDFISCGIAVFIAMILDSLDGRVARLTHTTSPFGAELDSLSDMVSFGVAPAIIAFNWHLHEMGKIGWLVTFIFCACGSLRLARFNTLIGIVDKRYFIGLPIPSAAALVVGYIYMCSKFGFDNKVSHILGVLVTLFAAFSMVCNVRFYSFKELNFYHKAKFRILLICLLLLVLLFLYPDIVIYGFFVGYTIVSYFIFIFNIKKASILVDASKDNPEARF